MKKIFLMCLMAMMFASCSEQITRGVRYNSLYDEAPKSIAVMPPINKTNFAEAKDYFYTTLHMPLCEKGYYVFPTTLTMEFFQQEGAYDSEMFIDRDLSIFKKVLDCDAVMFTKITKWEKKALFGTIDVDIEYLLKSTKTGATLFSRTGKITLDTSVNTGIGGGLGALANIAATALNTVATEKIMVGRACNIICLSDMPVGQYHVQYMQDQTQPASGDLIKGTVK